jgi:rhamnose transport system ATP-binding protein
MDSCVDIRGVSKSFGGVRALRDVSMDIRPGEVHALCGENGAGKSTLIKVLSGVYRPDAGRVVAWGSPLPLGDVRGCENAGVAVIHQESAAFADLDSADNIFVGREPVRLGGLLLDRRRMRSLTRQLMARAGAEAQLGTPVGEMSVARRQMVSLARALSHSCRLLVLDEPTASLSGKECEVLFGIIRQLRADGVSILYVSHRLEEVFALSDRVTVLRDGQLVGTRPTADVDRAELIAMMVGRELEALSVGPPARPPGDKPMLEVAGLGRRGVFEDITLMVRPGEIVGLAGLVGAGRSELARAIFGIDRPDTGRVVVNGRRLPGGSCRAAMSAGVALVLLLLLKRGIFLVLLRKPIVR